MQGLAGGGPSVIEFLQMLGWHGVMSTCHKIQVSSRDKYLLGLSLPLDDLIDLFYAGFINKLKNREGISNQQLCTQTLKQLSHAQQVNVSIILQTPTHTEEYRLPGHHKYTFQAYTSDFQSFDLVVDPLVFHNISLCQTLLEQHILNIVYSYIHNQTSNQQLTNQQALPYCQLNGKLIDITPQQHNLLFRNTLNRNRVLPTYYDRHTPIHVQQLRQPTHQSNTPQLRTLPSIPAQHRSEGEVLEGQLKFFDFKNRYGFMVRKDNFKDVFVHYSDLEKAGIHYEFLKDFEQYQVSFSFRTLKYVERGKEREKAVDIQLINEHQQ